MPNTTRHYRNRIEYRRFYCIVGATILLLILISPASASQDVTPDANSQLAPVDFETSIRPILRSRCYQCHAGEKREGDLQLDKLSSVRAGGHTGTSILGTATEESELLVRIRSDEVGYRMPKDNPRLADHEIELIERWIHEGADWTLESPSSQTLTDRLGDVLLRIQYALQAPRFLYPAYFVFPLLAILLVGIAAIRIRCSDAGRAGMFTWIRALRFKHFVALLALTMVGALLAYQFGLIEELNKSNERLQAQLPAPIQRKDFIIDLENPGLPPHPMHVKRLGGIYYRGNDERSPELFNGGFYRTATLAVWLINEQNELIEWDDAIDGTPLSVQFKIERAPGTTSGLFREEVISRVYLYHVPQSALSDVDGRSGESQSEEKRVNEEPADREKSNEAANGKRPAAREFSLTEIEPSQKWDAKIPLGSPLKWNSDVAQGVIYVSYGSNLVAGHRGRVHYAIKYSIKIVDGKISNDSEIWMGSIYNLAGRVLIPDDNKILLDRWFDFRPIPEIVGENSQDPVLLGLPEHLGKPDQDH